MSFLWPSFLWLVLLVPLGMVFLWLRVRRRRRTSQTLADAHLLPALLRQPSRAQRRWLSGLQLAALAALLVAAARPVAALPLPVNRAAVVIALDASQSMLADDMDPSRLEAARALAEAFVRGAPASTQIGLVSFSDLASVLVAPTTDRQVLLDALAQVQVARNTSLAAAVVTGVRLLPGRRDAQPPQQLEFPGTMPPESENDPDEPGTNLPPGSLLILSDGVSNVSGNPLLPAGMALELAGGFAADQEVRLYTLPVGREGGTVMQIDGQDYFIPFEPASLERLAEQTGGKHLDPADPEALQSMARELGRVIRWERSEFEVSSLLAGLAVLLMLIAGGLGLRWNRRIP